VDSEITGTVLSAAPRIVGNNKTIYDVAFSDGNTYVTFDAAIWAKVQTVGQQPASARVSVKQNGDFTNFYLNDIAPQGQLGPPGVTLHAPAPQQVHASPLAELVPAAQIARAPQSGGMTPEREQKIVKQSSFSTAFNFVGALYNGAGESEFEEAAGKALDLAKELYGQVMGNEPVTEPVAVEAPVAVPAAQNGQGDGIPW
jgi:hypothetical protein